MRVAHMVVITPGRCGLYETTRELVTGLRSLGVDSRMVDPPGANKLYPKGYPEDIDRQALIADMDWAVKADIVVSHSGYNGTAIDKTDQPIVHVAHGRPRSSFIGERDGGTPIYSYHYNSNSDARWRSVVTFWPEHYEYLRVMFPDKPIDVVKPPVDLEQWTPGEPEYRFNGKGGAINIVCTDPWRDDVDPFIPLNAFALWARTQQDAKLHLYAKQGNMKGYSAIIRRIQDDGNMGELLGWVDGLEYVYRSADMMLTANTIATRSVREAMACGCPVVRVGQKLNGYMNDFDHALVADRIGTRQLAKSRFDPEITALEFRRVLDRII